MRKKTLIISIALLVFLSSSIVFADSSSDPWDVGWQRVNGPVTASQNQDPKGKNIPHAGLDIVGDGTLAPARYAIDDDFIYFELRVAGSISLSDNGYNWMVLFYPADVLADPSGNFNSAIAQAGLRIDKFKGDSYFEVVIIEVEAGHAGDVLYSNKSENLYNITGNGGHQLVHWKIPRAVLPAGTNGFLLATGNSNNAVPNMDWYGWDFLPAVEQPVLTVSADPVAGGTVLGGGPYTAGTSVAVSATAAEGYTFVNWTKDGVVVSSTANFIYTMPAADTTLVAHFEPEPVPTYILTLEADPLAGGSVSGDGNYAAGTPVAVSATAAEGYRFVNWTKDGVVVSSTANFTYTMPAADTTLVAHFELLPPVQTYNLILKVQPPGSGTAVTQGTYEAGIDITVLATASSGYHFVGWTEEKSTTPMSVAGSYLSTDPRYTFKMPDRDYTLVAHFEEDPPIPGVFTLTLLASPTVGGIVKNNSQEGPYGGGTEVSVAATAHSGYRFMNWTVDGNVVSSSRSYTFAMPAADLVITANFSRLVTPDPEPDPKPEPEPEQEPDPAPEPEPELPVTGTNSDWLFPLGLAIMAAGALTVRRIQAN